MILFFRYPALDLRNPELKVILYPQSTLETLKYAFQMYYKNYAGKTELKSPCPLSHPIFGMKTTKK